MTDFERYGWKVNETNLATLPAGAPEEIKGLVKWLTLEGRRSSLEEWLGQYDNHTGRIHGKFWHIGAWTHRMSHSAPNQANIPSVFHDEPISPVEEVKHKYDGAMRACFYAPEGSHLVGTDADGIQLRILAHYMRSNAYKNAILKGDKSAGTDIHSLNMKALGPVCRDRDTAKTFIYAWLLGAGIPKIASILNTNVAQASKAVNSFLSSLPELKKLKDIYIPRDAGRGYFKGLDGRKVQCDSEHLMLAGYLQNGEAVVMKWAMRLWTTQADKEGLQYDLVDFVHDEWQTIVYGDRSKAERMGEIQRASIAQAGRELGLFCPLEGSTTIGHSWKETH